MAGVVAGAVFEILHERLVSLVQHRFTMESGVMRKVEELSTALDRIKVMLRDAEEKQNTESLLLEVRDELFVLEDMVDEFSTQFLRLSSFKRHRFIIRQGFGRWLKAITSRINRIAERMNKFLQVEGVKERPSEVAEWRQTSTIIGRGDDKEKVLEFLLSEARGSDFLSIYPIVGLGGVGKTTLAQFVYYDERVSSHFNKKIWLSVSEKFSYKKILCSIIDSTAGEKHDVYDLDVIERKVQELLQNKRYLLVLDNVWTTNQELELGLSQGEWNKLKSVLSCGSKGACILVSTRSVDVAATVGTCEAHHLSGLSEDECWLLFKQYAFGPDKEERAELVAIGKEIVNKCGGLPLAAITLGGLLRPKSEVKEWLKVKESKSWYFPDESSVLHALRLSYSYLTPTSKLCFAFCAIFPKSTEIMKEDLIHLWMANGYISSRGHLEVEEVGNITWNELYQKSFFKDVKTDDYSGDVSFKMHDLVHDLAQSVSGQECMILENVNMTDLSRSTLHIGFGSGLLSFNKGAFQKVKSLRTLYQFEFAFYNTISGYFPANRSLRVLSTSYFKLSSLRNLIYLRYLELYGFEIKNLPNSIYSLQKLETLKLISCRKLICLPKHLTRLQNLRHLVISECHLLSRLFPNMRKLSCLRTLSLFIVSLKKGHSLVELRDLYLGGKLRIEGLQNVGSLSEAQEANLIGKINLHELCLSWDNSGETKSNVTDTEQVLEALQPPSNLKTLRIYDYEGSHLPSWTGILQRLVALELFDCKKCLRLPQLGKLPFLRKLEIYSMEDVQYMDDDESYDGVEVIAFPSLKELEIRGLPNLQQLLKVEKGVMFPLISNVTIDDCSKLRLPSLPSIKQLNIRGCNHELLRSISSFISLTFLNLSGGEDLISFPEGMVRNLTCLKTLILNDFPKMKVLPYELLSLNALEHLEMKWCGELECLPEQVWEWKGLRSLQYLKIAYCGRLRSLPEGIQLVESLEVLMVLRIECCPELEKRCKDRTGEDWRKIAHVGKVILLQ